MEKPSRPVAYHALLCGVNFYKEKPLRGCVSDVEAIKNYLQNQSYSVQINLLSATSPTDTHENRPIEEPQQWPTHANVRSKLDDITSTVVNGDFVLVYFSGHGTRIPPSSTNQHIGDVALVLIEGPNGDMVRYLHGAELACLINKMVKKGACVTMILDCCYSGGVSREEDFRMIRCLNYSPEVDAVHPMPTQNPDDSSFGNIGSRDGSMLPNWLLNPDRYTILAACGPHETAGEIVLQDGKIHGALSYLLLHTLDQAGSTIKTFREMYQSLYAVFRSRHPRQNPALYGNGDLSFFGPAVTGSTPRIPVVDQESSGIVLDAGQAHGVCTGDVFTLAPYSAGSEIGTSSSRDPIQARVVMTRGLSSNLELVDETIKDVHIGSGWTAKAQCLASLQKYPVIAAIPPDDLVSLQVAAKDKSSLPILVQDSECHGYYHLDIDDSDNYLIKDATGTVIPHLPTLSRSSEGVIDELHDVLKHLATFEHIKNLRNLSSIATFSSAFQVHVLTTSGDRFGIESEIKVRHNDSITLELENHSRKSLYFYIYSLAPGWKIEQLFKASYLVVPPAESDKNFSGTARKKIRMTLPEYLLKRNLSECTDIIKIFVTMRPTCFDTLEMPRIIASGKANVTTSSSVQITTGNCFEENLEDWFALNFQLRTCL